MKIIFNLLAYSILLNTKTFCVFAADKPREVVFLPQTHASPFEFIVPEAMEVQAKSQLTIAQYLLAHPNSVVISEGMFPSLPPLQPESEDLNKLYPWPSAKTSFPKGLPKSVDELTFSQRQYLINQGGVETAVRLGATIEVIPYLLPDEEIEWDRETSKIRQRQNEKVPLTREILKQENYFIDTWREEKTMNAIVRVAKNPKYKDKEIVLVFGRAHDFSDNFKEHPELKLFTAPRSYKNHKDHKAFSTSEEVANKQRSAKKVLALDNFSFSELSSMTLAFKAEVELFNTSIGFSTPGYQIINSGPDRSAIWTEYLKGDQIAFEESIAARKFGIMFEDKASWEDKFYLDIAEHTLREASALLEQSLKTTQPEVFVIGEERGVDLTSNSEPIIRSAPSAKELR